MSQALFRPLRAPLQMVFQEPFASLNPRMRIGRIVEEPLLLAGERNARVRRDRCEEVLRLVGLPASARARFPHQFNAGEQPRIGIARAIATKPDLVVLDEPTSALDVSVRAEILDLLDALQRELNLAYLFISHDLTAVRRVCQRVAVMYLGCIVEAASSEEPFPHPQHPYSRALPCSPIHNISSPASCSKVRSRARLTCGPAVICTSAVPGRGRAARPMLRRHARPPPVIWSPVSSPTTQGNWEGPRPPLHRHKPNKVVM